MMDAQTLELRPDACSVEADSIQLLEWMWSPDGLGLRPGSMALVIYARIYAASHNGQGVYCESQTSLARKCGYSRQRVCECLSSLVKRRLVRVVATVGHKRTGTRLYAVEPGPIMAAAEGLRAAKLRRLEAVQDSIDDLKMDFSNAIVEDSGDVADFQQHPDDGDDENYAPLLDLIEEEQVGDLVTSCDKLSPDVTGSSMSKTTARGCHRDVAKGDKAFTCGNASDDDLRRPLAEDGLTSRESGTESQCIELKSVQVRVNCTSDSTYNEKEKKNARARRAKDASPSAASRRARQQRDDLDRRFGALPDADRAAWTSLLRKGRPVCADKMDETVAAYLDALATLGATGAEVVRAWDAYVRDYWARGHKDGRRLPYLVTFLSRPWALPRYLTQVREEGRRRHGGDVRFAMVHGLVRPGDTGWVALRGGDTYVLEGLPDDPTHDDLIDAWQRLGVREAV